MTIDVEPAILDMMLIEITMGLLLHVNMTMGVILLETINKDGLHKAKTVLSLTSTLGTTSKVLAPSAPILSILLVGSAFLKTALFLLNSSHRTH